MKKFKPISRALNWLFCKTIGRKYTGGATIDSVIKRAKQLNERGCRVIINVLGEHYRKKEEVDEAVDTYCKLLEVMKRENILGGVSIKPTQFGFYVPAGTEEERDKYTQRKMLEVLTRARDLGITPELDMEDRETVEFIKRFYLLVNPNMGGGIRLALQANEIRTPEILELLIGLSTPETPYGTRLVKGIYPNTYPGLLTNEKVMEEFRRLVTIAISTSGPEFSFALGSHHSEVIALALNLLEQHPKDSAEIQLLFGVMNQLIEPIQERGAKVAIYLPFGKDGFFYSFRRMRKNPRFLWKVLTSALRRKYDREITSDSSSQGNTGELN